MTSILPTLFCPKNAGLVSSSLIAIIIIKYYHDAKIKPIKANTISINLLIIRLYILFTAPLLHHKKKPYLIP